VFEIAALSEERSSSKDRPSVLRFVSQQIIALHVGGKEFRCAGGMAGSNAATLAERRMLALRAEDRRILRMNTERALRDELRDCTMAFHFEMIFRVQAEETRFDGIHCDLVIEKPSPGVLVMKIRGTDIGEFRSAPMKALDDCLDHGCPVDLFIDARDVRGASIEVSCDWAGWLNARRAHLRSVTMLTGSRFIQVTAEFVRRFAHLEGSMRICTDPAAFEQALQEVIEG
jgi:hypothetical protein